VEGVRLVEEALQAHVPLRGAVYSPGLEATPRGRALKAALRGTGVPVLAVRAAALDELADTEHPQGVIAVVQPRRWTLEELRPGPRGVILVLDGVQDPGNVGTLWRTAFALGSDGLVALKGTAELTNPKVLRGSMGAAFRLPAVRCGDEAFLSWAREAKASLLVADAGGLPIGRGPRPGPVALAVGNEGVGVRPVLVRAAAELIAIPMREGAESLNVAVAAGILLWEVTRDR